MSFCEHCTQGYVLPGEPTGSFQHIEPTGAYCKFYDGELVPPKKIAIILLTDIFGLDLKNSKILADRLSEKCQCDVWVPDFFAGKPPMKESQIAGVFPDHASIGLSIAAKLRFLWIVLFAIPSLFANRSSVVDDRIQTFLKNVKEERKYEKIGVVGYCFGGAAAVRLASTGLIDSVVICHPGNISVNEIRAMKAPASWVCAELDYTFVPSLRRAAEEVYASRKDKASFIVYEFCDYKGTVHGFAARPNLALPDVKDGFEKAFKQTYGWFNDTLYNNSAAV